MIQPKEHFHGSDLEKIEAYYGIKKETIVSFSANVNPLGISPKLRQGLMDHIEVITSYPDREYTALRQCLGSYLNTPWEHILVGNGSTELISLFLQMTHPKKALLLAPTYSEYEREITLGGGEVIWFPLSASQKFSCPVDALCESLTPDFDLCVLCNPNNPTSTIIPRGDLIKIAEHANKHHIMVVIDETYVEFCEDYESVTAVPLTEIFPNLIILRGISKFFAAPGLRLGYAVCSNQDLMAQINRFKNPWTINSLAEAATQLMFTDTAYMEQTRLLMKEQRQKICHALDQLPGLEYIAPHANFILVHITNQKLTADQIFDTAIREHLMIRDCSDFPYLDETYFRFCFMSPAQNDQLLKCLSQLFQD